jgi:hypothetical protein
MSDRPHYAARWAVYCIILTQTYQDLFSAAHRAVSGKIEPLVFITSQPPHGAVRNSASLSRPRSGRQAPAVSPPVPKRSLLATTCPARNEQPMVAEFRDFAHANVTENPGTRVPKMGEETRPTMPG